MEEFQFEAIVPVRVCAEIKYSIKANSAEEANAKMAEIINEDFPCLEEKGFVSYQYIPESETMDEHEGIYVQGKGHDYFYWSKKDKTIKH